MESRLCLDPETACAWVDSVFEAIGPAAKDRLNSFEIDAKAPSEARQLAGMRLGQLKEELSLPLQGGDTAKPWDLLRGASAVSPDWLLGKLAEHSGTIREDAFQHGYAHVVAPDCDGTLWYGDIGDLFFERALTERWLQGACSTVLNELCDRYGIKVFRDVNDTARSMMNSKVDGSFLVSANRLGVDKNEAYRQFYATQGLCMGGLSVGFIKARTFEIMNEAGGLKERIFPEVQAVLEELAKLGLVVVPISASLNLLVEVGVTFLGIPGRRALGVTTPHENGLLVPKLIEPMPYGEGKITLISQMGGLPPAIALGDSWQRTDKELLHGAGLGLVISHDERPDAIPGNLICLDIKKPDTSS
jgi:phosphoserine phosphatase